MKPSLLAILARFQGDREQAKDYCLFIVQEHPQLAQEYQLYADALEAPCVTS